MRNTNPSPEFLDTGEKAELAATSLPYEEPAWETDDDPLILWMLSLSSTERLAAAQGFVDSVQAFRDAARSDEIS